MKNEKCIYKIKAPTEVTMAAIRWMVKNHFEFKIQSSVDVDAIFITINNLNEKYKVESYFENQILLWNIMNMR